MLQGTRNTTLYIFRRAPNSARAWRNASRRSVALGKDEQCEAVLELIPRLVGSDIYREAAP